MPLLEEELNTAISEDTLFHEETLLVIATNHIALCVCVCACVCVYDLTELEKLQITCPNRGRLDHAIGLIPTYPW